VTVHSSSLSEPNNLIETSVTCGEHLPAIQSYQPTGTTVDLNSTAAGAGVVSEPIPHGVTTLAIRNVSARYTKAMLMQEWPLDGTYDFLYLPFNFKQKRGAGLAFVNFTSHAAAVGFYSQWHRKHLREHGSARRLSIGVAEAQGLDNNLRHVASCNVGRITNPKFLPSVFNGMDEVPFAGLLEQNMVSGIGNSTGER